DLITPSENTSTNCDAIDMQSDKPLPKTKKLMEYSSKKWSDIVEENEAMIMSKESTAQENEMIDTSLKQPSVANNFSKEIPSKNIEGKKENGEKSKELHESNVVLENSNNQPTTSTILSSTQIQENENKLLFETTVPVVGSKKEPDTIKDKSILEEQTSTVDIVTKTEPTGKEPNKCFSKDNIPSDNSPIQESIDHGKKEKSSNTKILQSKKEDGFKVEGNVTSSTSSNNSKEEMNKKNNNEQPLVNLTAPINNLEKNLKTLSENTSTDDDNKVNPSEKQNVKIMKINELLESTIDLESSITQPLSSSIQSSSSFVQFNENKPLIKSIIPVDERKKESMAKKDTILNCSPSVVDGSVKSKDTVILYNLFNLFVTVLSKICKNDDTTSTMYYSLSYKSCTNKECIKYLI
ncbi:myb-like protein X, partial [Sipha flava]|uniref:Myb-like protein X n=2 Tax=Sipha flava TaxID=143950 RepID=A0A8B8G556_9HEMI